MICASRRSGRSSRSVSGAMSRPSNWIEPERGTSIRMTACAVVVLPQPDSPTSATSSPAATVSETPSTARTTRSSRRGDRADQPRGIG